MSITARFPSRCGLCDELIYEGDEIEQIDDEWCHSDCVADFKSAVLPPTRERDP